MSRARCVHLAKRWRTYVDEIDAALAACAG
jgi:hypothetical protein